MSQCADNFRFDITAWRGHHDFDFLTLCLKLAFANHSHASHWSIHSGVKKTLPGIRADRTLWDKKPRLILHWHNLANDARLIPFLGKTDHEAASSAVISWLKDIDYGQEPDHDGDNSKGWRIFNEAWGHVDDFRGAICAIEPEWLMHGK